MTALPNADIHRGVAYEVRRLITQAEQGRPFDFETTGHAYDVIQEAVAFVATRLNGTALAVEIEKRVEFFARSKGSAQMYLRLVVTDVAPDLPEYDPSEVVIFDGVNEGTNFSTANMRLTHLGTVMTSGDVTDLRAYFESGHKRILVAYLGTDRNADAKAHDKLLSVLPGLLAAAGMDAASIKAVIETVKAGNLPAIAVKILHQMVEISQLKAILQAHPLSVEIQHKLTTMEREFTSLLGRIQGLPSLSPVFAKIFSVMASQDISVLALKGTASPQANDNSLSIRAARELIQALRQTAKDKTLPLIQRREIAAVLRELRAGVRATNPAPIRLVNGLALLNGFLATVINQPQPPRIFERILLHTVSTTLALAASPFLALFRPAFADILQDTSIPIAARQTLIRAMEKPKAAEALSRFVMRHPETIRGITSPILARTLNIVKPDKIFTSQSAMPVRKKASMVTPQIDKASQVTTETKTVDSISPRSFQAPTVIKTPTEGQAIKPIADAPKAAETLVDIKITAPVAEDSKPPIILAFPASKSERAHAEVVLRSGEGPLQYNPDGTLKDCCKKPFQEAAALREALANTPTMAGPVTHDAPESKLLFVTDDGKFAAPTAQQVSDNITAHEKIQVGPMLDIRGSIISTANPATEQFWSDSTLKLLATPTPESGIAAGFNRKTEKAIESQGASVDNRNLDVTFVAITPPVTEAPTSNRPRRTLRPI